MPYHLDIATQGLLSNNSVQIFAQGLLKVVIDDIIIPDVIPSGGIGSIPTSNLISKKDKKNHRKRISVTLIYNGQEYTKYAITSDLNITIDKVKVEVIEENFKPKISIKIIP